MKQVKRCECCGARLESYQVKITPMLVRALAKFRLAVADKGINEVHIRKDMAGKPYEFTRLEWNNFSRQRFLGLAVKVKDKAGYWLLTRRGGEFLNGMVDIPSYVKIFRNEIVERSEELVNIKHLSPEVPYMEKVADIVYEPVILGQAKLL